MIDLREAREIGEKATKAPWTHDSYPLLQREAAKDWICEATDKGGDGLELVQSTLPKVGDDAEHPTVMTTGNGPTSGANAEFILSGLHGCSRS